MPRGPARLSTLVCEICVRYPERRRLLLFSLSRMLRRTVDPLVSEVLRAAQARVGLTLSRAGRSPR